MIKLFCDLCEKEIINQDYVEQSIFNHFNFEQSAEGIFCKECWEKQSPTSQTSPKGDFSKEKEHNISLKDNSNELSQILSNDETSLNNNIQQNFPFALQSRVNPHAGFEVLPLTLQSEIGGNRIISLIKGNLKN